MIKGIEFNNGFSKEDYDNLFYKLTKNTIIICENFYVKNKLTKEIIGICDGKHSQDGHICCSTDHDKEKIPYKIFIQYRPTTILDLKGQRIIITTECPFIYQCKSPKDLWFCVEGKETDDNDDSLLHIYPLTIFKGHKETWKKGLGNVYYETLCGHFGTFGYGQ